MFQITLTTLLKQIYLSFTFSINYTFLCKLCNFVTIKREFFEYLKISYK
jgi:hypothetical protein